MAWFSTQSWIPTSPPAAFEEDCPEETDRQNLPARESTKAITPGRGRAHTASKQEGTGVTKAL